MVLLKTFEKHATKMSLLFSFIVFGLRKDDLQNQSAAAFLTPCAVILKVGKNLCTVIRLQMAYIQSNSVSVQLCFLYENSKRGVFRNTDADLCNFDK
jgi:hypothetical protein